MLTRSGPRLIRSMKMYTPNIRLRNATTARVQVNFHRPCAHGIISRLVGQVVDERIAQERSVQVRRYRPSLNPRETRTPRYLHLASGVPRFQG